MYTSAFTHQHIEPGYVRVDEVILGLAEIGRIFALPIEESKYAGGEMI